MKKVAHPYEIQNTFVYININTARNLKVEIFYLISYLRTLIFWISGSCGHPGDNNNNNKSPKNDSFVSVSEGREEFVRPLCGRHSREGRVRARFRRMRMEFEHRSYYR